MKKLLTLIIGFLLITQNVFAAFAIDNMEYASDAAAQTEWVSSESEVVTVSQLNEDDDIDFAATEDGVSQGFKVSSTATITKFTVKAKYRVSAGSGTATGYIYSDDGSGKPNSVLATFSTLDISTLTASYVEYHFTGTYVPTVGTQYHLVILEPTGFDNTSFSCQTSNPYADGIMNYRVLATQVWTTYAGYDMYFKLWQENLQCYSESTNITQGSYSLKVIAPITESLNDTLTNTVAYDFSGINLLRFDMRSSRTGSNIKIGLVDTDATTETTPNQLVADTFQTNQIDLSAVDDGDKDGITSIVFTVTNADAANTFYIDDFKAICCTDVFGWID